MKTVSAMSIISILGLLAFLLLNSGCGYDAEGDVSTPNQDWQSYQLSSFYTEGVDDQGNTWVALTGSFSDYGNTVQVVCDGNQVNAQVMTQSESEIEVAVPAASQYQECDFSVYTNDGYDLGTLSGSVTAIVVGGPSPAQK